MSKGRCWWCGKAPIGVMILNPSGRRYCSEECRDEQAADTVEAALLNEPRPPQKSLQDLIYVNIAKDFRDRQLERILEGMGDP